MLFADVRNWDQSFMAKRLDNQARTKRKKQDAASTVPSEPPTRRDHAPAGQGPARDLLTQTLEISSGDEELDEPSELSPPPTANAKRMRLLRSDTISNSSSVRRGRPRASKERGRTASVRSSDTTNTPARRGRPRKSKETSGSTSRRTEDATGDAVARGSPVSRAGRPKKREGSSIKTNRAAGASQGDKEDPTCDFCRTHLPGRTRFRCQDCPFNLCSICKANLRILYPDHTSSHSWTEERCPEMTQGAIVQDLKPSGTADTISSPSSASGRNGGQEQEEELRGGHFTCAMCGQQLETVRYECQECPGTNLCEEDRDFHIAKHTLKPIQCWPTRSNCSSQGRSTFYTDKAKSPDGSRPKDRRVATVGASKWSDTEEETGDEADEIQGHSRDGAGAESGGDDIFDSVDGRDVEFDDELGVVDAGDSDYVSSATRRRRRRTSRMRPGHFTLSLPVAGYHVYEAWARAILDHGPPGAPPSPGKRRQAGKKRAWLPEDQEQLRELKEQGLTDEDAAKVLGRSAGAVTQQWRKQR